MSRKHTIRYFRELSDEEHAAFLAEANARETRTRGRRGLKIIGYAPPDEDWSALVEALVEHGTIDRSDQTEACKGEWLKDFTCAGCGSSSGFARRDKGGKYTGIRITCSHQCKTGDVLRTLGVRSEMGEPALTIRSSSPGSSSPSSPRSSSSESLKHRGQARMAYRLADAYEGKLLFVHGIGWHTWDGHRWIEDRQGAAKRAVLAVLRAALAESLDDRDLRADVRKCETAAGIAGVLDIAAALEVFAFTVADLDADPYLINTAAGTLDLRTMQISEPDPADRITKITAGAYRPDESGLLWPGFLERVLPDAEVRGFVQRLAGVGLLGVVVEQILAILTGTGANGKGVFYGALGHALGDYATVAEPELFMHREGAHPTGEMDLRGIRWVVVSESDKDRRLAEATVKRLTGGDTIKARRMRQDFVSFQPSHTPLLVTNHLPKVSGDDPALWRRLRVVPFDVVIPEDERDPHLPEQLQLEADAVLTWAVDGYRDYVNRGGLADPPQVKAATDRYQQDSDAVSRFVAECCLTGTYLSMTTAEAFQRWLTWSQADGAEQLSQKAFGQALDRLGYPAGPARNGRRPRVGIGLAADDDGGDE